MKGTEEACREEVIAQNLLAAQAQSGSALDDPEAMILLEMAVSTSDQGIYELSLGRVIARLAEELSAMEVQIEGLKAHREREEEREEPVLAGRSRR